MSNGEPRPGEADPDTLVAEAEAQVLRCGRRLAAIIARLEAGELAASGEVPGAVAALDKALAAVFSERARRDRLGGAPAAGGELDLDAARAEVRRRLDRLRAAGDAGGLPGQSE